MFLLVGWTSHVCFMASVCMLARHKNWLYHINMINTGSEYVILDYNICKCICISI